MRAFLRLNRHCFLPKAFQSDITTPQNFAFSYCQQFLSTNVSWIFILSSPATLLHLILRGGLQLFFFFLSFCTLSANCFICKIPTYTYNGKSRHIRQRHNTLKQLLSSGIITIDFVGLKDNIVDSLNYERPKLESLMKVH